MAMVPLTGWKTGVMEILAAKLRGCAVTQAVIDEMRAIDDHIYCAAMELQRYWDAGVSIDADRRITIKQQTVSGPGAVGIEL